jgi:3D (Asp-Asp-Asp) domain-containing protein/septal ring factor EnvC (AmiA/AmiB activator)
MPACARQDRVTSASPLVASALLRRWPALAGVAALCAALATTGDAASVVKLRERQAALASRQTAAALELYALQTSLVRAEARLASLRARREAVEEELARVRIELDVAWRSVYAGQARLGARIRQLYAHGRIDPVAVLLGSESLDEAVSGLEGLRRLASGDRELLRQVTQARNELRRAKARVKKRAAALQAAEADAAEVSAYLRAAAAERLGYLTRLAAERGYNRRQIVRLEAVVRVAQDKTASVAVRPANAPDAAPEATPLPSSTAVEPLGDGTQLTVVATGYAIRGRTATGLATSWGVVAVDPSVIPLGTKMTIPGYGVGVAADTGGSVQGNVIDLWFPTVAQALAWGRRTVTITLRG